MIGSNNIKKFKNFQIRWNEKLGFQNEPYLIRWTIILFGYSIRLHHWIKSDDNRYFHDHSSKLISIVIKGHYWNVTPIDNNKNPNEYINIHNQIIPNKKYNHVEGIFNSWNNFIHMNKSIWKSNPYDLHYLKIPKEGAWTLLIEGKKCNKWGFIVNGHKWRPLRYFHKFGIIQKQSYQ